MIRAPNVVTTTTLAIALASDAHAVDLPLFLACDTRPGTEIAVLVAKDEGLVFTFGDQPPIVGVEPAGTFAYRITADPTSHHYTYLREVFEGGNWELATMREGQQSTLACSDVSDLGAAAVRLADDRVRELSEELSRLQAQLERSRAEHSELVDDLRLQLRDQSRTHAADINELRQKHSDVVQDLQTQVEGLEIQIAVAEREHSRALERLRGSLPNAALAVEALCQLEGAHEIKFTRPSGVRFRACGLDDR